MKVIDLGVYLSAFTHRSAATESVPSYERLEFLGDSVISFCVAKWLFEHFGEADEGILTRLRTKLVSGPALAAISNRLGLSRYVQMNARGLRQQWHMNKRIQEDVFEALCGALYLDCGLVAAKSFLINLIESTVDYNHLLKEDNHKDVLMKYAQATGDKQLPEYKCCAAAASNKTTIPPTTTTSSVPSFAVTVTIGSSSPTGFGTGSTKRAAEQAAAASLLEKLGVTY
jgi:ribonuclease III